MRMCGGKVLIWEKVKVDNNNDKKYSYKNSIDKYSF